MYLKDKHFILGFLCILASCASDTGPYKWQQFRGSVGFEDAENFCKPQDEIYRSNLATSLFDTAMLAMVPPSGAAGYSKGMAERPQGPAGMSMETCMKNRGWQKVTIHNPN